MDKNEASEATGHVTEERELTFKVHEAIEAKYGMDRLADLLSGYTFANATVAPMVKQVKHLAQQLERGVDPDWAMGFVFGVIRFNLDADPDGPRLKGFEEGLDLARIVNAVHVENGYAGLTETVARMRAGDVEALEAAAEGKTLKSRMG